MIAAVKSEPVVCAEADLLAVRRRDGRAAATARLLADRDQASATAATAGRPARKRIRRRWRTPTPCRCEQGCRTSELLGFAIAGPGRVCGRDCVAKPRADGNRCGLRHGGALVPVLDLEVAVLAPGRAPGVLHDCEQEIERVTFALPVTGNAEGVSDRTAILTPVELLDLMAPTDNLDGVAAKLHA
eukprot:6489999-Prymnesium_polylepis.1